MSIVTYNNVIDRFLPVPRVTEKTGGIMQSKGIQAGKGLCKPGTKFNLRLNLILPHLNGRNFHPKICSCNYE